MKRVLFCVILLSFCSIINATPKTWIGASGGLWSAGTNWSPAGVPASGDDITITAYTGTIIVDVVSPIALNSIAVINNSTVVFDCSATKNFRLSSISTITPGLQVDGGSTFTLNASNATTNNSALDLTFGIGVIGSIYGTLVLSNTGGATNGTQLITYTDATHYAILTVYSGGIIKSTPNTQNTVSSLTPVPTLIMKTGSIYEVTKNGGSFPTGFWEPNSLARALSPGMNVPSFFNGTTYGNLEWNCPAQIASGLNANITFNNVNFISTGLIAFRIKTGASVGNYTMTINGNLDISATTLIDIVSLNSLATSIGKIILKGHLNNRGTITTNGISTTTSEFELNGLANQNITNTGLLSGVRLSFIMNNAAGATLLTPVTLPNKLTLTSGKIKTTSTNVLSMVTGGTVSGGSSTSFVEGPMKKGGNDMSFVFPIGVGSIYSPATYFSFGITSSDTIRAEYIRTNPQGVYGFNYSATGSPEIIDHVSFVEYWTMKKTSGTFSSFNLALTVTQYSFCKDVGLDSTFIARHDHIDNFWKNCGTNFHTPGAPVGSFQTGSISTVGQFDDDSIFTLATNASFDASPLPITLISFDASKLTNTKSTINWELAACCSAAVKFEIQRAEANKNFTTIGTIGGSETNKLYSYIDNDLKNGINYYRLKMIDEGGKITYSRTVAVMNGVNGLMLTSLIPTMVTNSAILTIASSGQQKLDLIITDMQGRIVQKQNHTISAGNTNIQLSTDRLAAGVYQITGVTTESKTNVIRFIKQ
jgi:hypothetical protein